MNQCVFCKKKDALFLALQYLYKTLKRKSGKPLSLKVFRLYYAGDGT